MTELNGPVVEFTCNAGDAGLIAVFGKSLDEEMVTYFSILSGKLSSLWNHKESESDSTA